MKDRIKEALGFDDETFADFVAGLAGGFTMTVGLYALHSLGYLG